jgi:hypothetical protein
VLDGEITIGELLFGFIVGMGGIIVTILALCVWLSEQNFYNKVVFKKPLAK